MNIHWLQRLIRFDSVSQRSDQQPSEKGQLYYHIDISQRAKIRCLKHQGHTAFAPTFTVCLASRDSSMASGSGSDAAVMLPGWKFRGISMIAVPVTHHKKTE